MDLASTALSDDGAVLKSHVLVQYDARGNVARQLDREGHEWLLAYDAEDRITDRIDAAGRATQLFYDGTGKPTRTRYVDGTESVSGYDAAGRLSSVRDRRGFETVFGYDLAGRQTLVRDALTHESTTAYDPAGRRTSVTDANGHTTSFGYDAAGRLTSTTHPDGTISRTEYDALGRVTAEIDPAGTRTGFGYDAVGRLVLVRDAMSGETRFEYDALGNRTAMIDALGRRRSYEYDGLGRQIAEARPQGERSTRTVDATGQQIESVDFNGKKTTRAYDRNGRLVFEQHESGAATAYAYTSTGQLALVQEARGVTRFAYDENDRLVEKVNPGGATLRYGYDAEGNRTRLETPSGTTLYGYDAVGRPSTILDPQGGITSFGHDNAGNRTSLVHPNGMTTTYARDPRDRLTTIESRTAGSTLLARYAYTLDAAGNRTGVTEHTGRAVSWQYDALSRLLSETIESPSQPAETESFGYDAVGNRLTRTSASGLETSLYDANDRLLSDGTASYRWDANGNLQSKTDAGGTTQYRFDAKDRLVEVSATVGLVQHVYDDAGDRVETKVDCVATKYLVDANRGLSQILEERTTGGSLVASYVHSDDGMPLSRFDGATSATSYYLHDAQQSVRQLASGGGAITDAYSYSAFGTTRSATGSTPNVHRYGGQWSDARSGLYQLRVRWMDPGLGRFVSTDPFVGVNQDPLTLHRYLYANAGPITHADPTGRITLGELNTTISSAGSLAAQAIPNFLRFASIARATQVALGSVPLLSAIGPFAQRVLAGSGPQGLRALQSSIHLVARGQAVVSQRMLETAWNVGTRYQSTPNRVFGVNAKSLDLEYHRLIEESFGLSASLTYSLSNIVPTPTAVHRAITAVHGTLVGPGQRLRDLIASRLSNGSLSVEAVCRFEAELWQLAMSRSGAHVAIEEARALLERIGVP